MAQREEGDPLLTQTPARTGPPPRAFPACSLLCPWPAGAVRGSEATCAAGPVVVALGGSPRARALLVFSCRRLAPVSGEGERAQPTAPGGGEAQ